MADTLDLLTLEEGYRAVNDEVNADGASIGSTGTRDGLMALWITGVSRRFDELCGPVVQRTVTGEAHDGGRLHLWLRETPIVSVTTVTEYDDTTATVLTAETNATKPADGYVLESRRHFVRLVRRSSNGDRRFATGRQNVVVTYEAGRYASTATVDERFKLVAGAAMRRLVTREAGAWSRGGDPFAQAGAGTAGFFKVVDPLVHELLHDELRPPALA